MYNFNQTSLSTPPMLGVGMEFCSGTPRTPEILNSLIAMTNPFEYSYASSLSASHHQNQVIPVSSSSMSPTFDTSPVITCKMENNFMSYDNNSQSNCSSSSSLESPSTTPLHMSSPMLSSSTSSTTPSLQQTRSQLIKAGVKLLIQNKRKNSNSSSCDNDCKPPPLKIRVSSPTTSNNHNNNNNNFIPIASNEVPSSSASSTLTSPKQLTSPISVRSFPLKSDSTTSCDDDDFDMKPSKASKLELTPEDEDRRRRRRERNKIAATKCRLKKRECINNLMRESEVLEAQNVDLKTQLKGLEEELKYLQEMWQAHQGECKNMTLIGSNGSRDHHQQQQHQQHNNNNNNNNNQNNMCSISELSELEEAIKDTNNNKHLNNLDLQLPSLTPLINCNVSFDFY